MKRGWDAAAWREHAPGILVAAISSTFGVTLVLATDALAVTIRDNETASGSATVVFVLGFIANVFLAIALYVGAIVTANTFETLIAGRVRAIALLRLLGSSARAERRRVSGEGLRVGIIGAALGIALGVAANLALIGWGRSAGVLPDAAYSAVLPGMLVPPVAVVLTTWLASWIGSRRVLTVTPLAALGAAVEPGEGAAPGPVRTAVAAVLVVLGAGCLALAVIAGQVTPAAILIGVLGGILSFSGIIAGAGRVVPLLLRASGTLGGRSAPARLAALNAVRYPQRSTRTALGLVIGVALLTMFAVASETARTIIHAAQLAQPEVYSDIDGLLSALLAVFSVLIGFSAVIAAVGVVNSLSLSVLQRRRELGLLRALGFTVRQVRAMVVAESAQLTLTAVAAGLALGTLYGWVGAQSLLLTITGSPWIVAPAMPLPFLGIVALASFVLAVGAALAPARRATSVSPVVALAAD